MKRIKTSIHKSFRWVFGYIKLSLKFLKHRGFIFLLVWKKKDFFFNISINYEIY
jgi:hypothetical protein